MIFWQEIGGVHLYWETSTEQNNAGFYVLKSRNQAGPFTKGSELIPPNPDRKYVLQDSEVEAGQTYYYRLEDVQIDGRTTQHDIIQVMVPVPESFELLQNFPNPFNPTTNIRFQLPRAAYVRLNVYDLLGRLVKTIVDGDYKPGYHQVLWDGLNDNGIKVTSGIYYYVLETADQRFVKKMCMLR